MEFQHALQPGISGIASQEEKRTDVNIAVFMVDDAFRDLCDQFIIFSGDSDWSRPSTWSGYGSNEAKSGNAAVEAVIEVVSHHEERVCRPDRVGAVIQNPHLQDRRMGHPAVLCRGGHPEVVLRAAIVRRGCKQSGQVARVKQREWKKSRYDRGGTGDCSPRVSPWAIFCRPSRARTRPMPSPRGMASATRTWW